jgi:hypothetical protein
MDQSTQDGVSADERIAIALQAFKRQQYREALGAMQQAVAADRSILRRYHIWLAHCTVLATAWQQVNACLPNGTNALTTTGWLQSLASGKPVNADGEPVPWYTYPAIDFVQTKIQPHFRVFEGGVTQRSSGQNRFSR